MISGRIFLDFLAGVPRCFPRMSHDLKGKEISSSSFSNPNTVKRKFEGSNAKKNEDIDFKVSKHVSPTSDDLQNFFQINDFLDMLTILSETANDGYI